MGQEVPVRHHLGRQQRVQERGVHHRGHDDGSPAGHRRPAVGITRAEGNPGLHPQRGGSDPGEALHRAHPLARRALPVPGSGDHVPLAHQDHRDRRGRDDVPGQPGHAHQEQA